MEKELTPEVKECNQTIMAIHDVMDILNGKWKVSIMACLCFKKMRYSELLFEVKGVSGKMLSRDLKELEANGLIKRTVLNTQPVTVEYEKTKYGATLNKVTGAIAEWGLAHRKKNKRKTNLITEYLFNNNLLHQFFAKWQILHFFKSLILFDGNTYKLPASVRGSE